MGESQPIKRGDIWYVHLEDAQGSKTQKTRPAIVIQNDIGNAYSPITIIAPITSNTTTIRPTDAPLFPGTTGLSTPSKALLNQIRAIEKSRLVQKIGVQQDLREVDYAIQVSLGLITL